MSSRTAVCEGSGQNYSDALFEVARRTDPTTVDLVICPPFPYLFEARRLRIPITLGAQDVSAEIQGAHTSNVSPLLLKDAEVAYVIIGHSERRAEGETDDIVHKKMRVTLETGLHPILCIGEPAAIRSQGLETTRTFIYNQLKKAFGNIESSLLTNGNITIAYEPLWAISVNGKGASDKPEDAVHVINFIRELLEAKPYGIHARILYGGSIRATNIQDFLKYSEIDGALIGKASTEPEEFEAILKQVSSSLSEVPPY